MRKFIIFPLVAFMVVLSTEVEGNALRGDAGEGSSKSTEVHPLDDPTHPDHEEHVDAFTAALAHSHITNPAFKGLGAESTGVHPLDDPTHPDHEEHVDALTAALAHSHITNLATMGMV